jgi:hypothetical protein
MSRYHLKFVLGRYGAAKISWVLIEYLSLRRWHAFKEERPGSGSHWLADVYGSEHWRIVTIDSLSCSETWHDDRSGRI